MSVLRRLTRRRAPQLWRLTPRHARDWRAIRIDALRNAPTAFGPQDGDSPDLPLGAFAAQLERAEFWAAGWDRAKPLAVAGFEPDERGRSGLGWVTSVYVLPAARGHGLAAAVLAQVLRRARAAGMNHLALRVGADNLAAQRLYRRAGFVPVAPNPALAGLQGSETAEIEMCRRLRPRGFALKPAGLWR